MNTFEMVAIHLIFLATAVLTLFLLKTPANAGPNERKLQKMMLIGFLLFHGVRWLPFAFGAF